MNQDSSTRRESTQKLYEAVREEFHRMSDIRKEGVRVYSYEYIYTELARKFYRSPETIKNIVFHRV